MDVDVDGRWMQTHIFPLGRISHESGHSEQSHETEELHESQHLQGPRGIQYLRTPTVALGDDEEDVVHGHGRDEVYPEPPPHVTGTDHLEKREVSSANMKQNMTVKK